MEKLKEGKIYFERIFLKLRDDPKIILINIVAFLFSFILSHSKLASGISPFGIAFCAAAPGELLFSSFLGQAFGYAASQSIINTLRYVASSVVIKFLVFKVSKSYREFFKVWFLTPICVFCVTFLLGVISQIFVEMNTTVFFSLISESATAAICSYFFSQSFELLDSDEDWGWLSPRRFVCIVFSFGVFLLSFSSFRFYEISLSRVLVGSLILLFAFAGGEIASCVVGVIGGLSVGIYTGSSFDIVSLSLSGLITGVFSPLGSVGCIASFVVSQLALFFFSAPKSGLFTLCAECASSVTLFFLLPKNFSVNLKNVFLPAMQNNAVFDTRKEISEKLTEASDCLGEISQSIDKISERLGNLEDSNVKAIYCKVQADVCENCQRHDYCFEKNFKQTYYYFERISKIFSEKTQVGIPDLPEKFSVICKQSEEFLLSFEKHYDRHLEFMRREMEVQDSRNVLRDHLECAKNALMKISSDISGEKISDIKTASKIKSIMRKHSVKAQSVVCIIDEKGVMSINAVLKNYESDINKEKLLCEIEDATLRKFERPSVSYLDTGISFQTVQKPRISVSSGLCKVPGRSASLCGDQCDFFKKDGVFSVIVSDGMGTGGRAAVDSTMSAEYFKKLIKSGFSEDVALDIVNNCMLVKSSYESLSTIDYAKIDLFTGKTQLFKAGAAATIIRKNGKCIVCQDASLPIGILREIGFSKECFSLCPDDIIVMMSDGATACGTEWIEKEVQNYCRTNAEDLARTIALKAIEINPAQKQDDVTVFAAILS